MKIYKVKVNGKVYEVELEAVTESDKSIKEEVVPSVQKEERPVPTPTSSTGGNQVLAPIGGKVLDVKVSINQQVKKGDTLLIIEAMKLENEVKSQFDGKVVDIKVSKDASVNNKDLLMIIE